MIFGIDQVPSNQPAMLDRGGISLTYGQLRDQVKEIGQLIEKRCLVFCICENSWESVAAYLACLEADAVAMLIGANLSEILLDELFVKYQPQYVFCRKEQSRKDIFRMLLEVGDYVLYGTDCEALPTAEELALLLPTSGSTGSPKYVRLSKKNLESNACAIADYLKLTHRERPITVLPMQYAYGLSVINSHLAVGACILLTTDSILQQDFWDFLEREKASSISGVPFTYELLHRMHFQKRKEIHSIHTMTQAGGHLDRRLQEIFGTYCREHGIDFYIMYGQTEATARMSYLPPKDCHDKPDSIGIPIPGGRFELMDEDGNVIDKDGALGELVYYGQNVSLGYAGECKDLCLGDERKGCLFTGDLALRDKDGFYYIKGRKKRFIKIYGNRVGLDECEHILKNHYPGNEFACVGCDDHLHIFTNCGDVKYADLYLADLLGLHEQAFCCHYVAELPRNEAGKIQYGELPY